MFWIWRPHKDISYEWKCNQMKIETFMICLKVIFVEQSRQETYTVFLEQQWLVSFFLHESNTKMWKNGNQLVYLSFGSTITLGQEVTELSYLGSVSNDTGLLRTSIPPHQNTILLSIALCVLINFSATSLRLFRKLQLYLAESLISVFVSH